MHSLTSTGVRTSEATISLPTSPHVRFASSQTYWSYALRDTRTEGVFIFWKLKVLNSDIDTAKVFPKYSLTEIRWIHLNLQLNCEGIRIGRITWKCRDHYDFSVRTKKSKSCEPIYLIDGFLFLYFFDQTTVFNWYGQGQLISRLIQRHCRTKIEICKYPLLA